MKRIGMIGGVTWQSTIEYYRIINEYIGQKLGGTHSANMVIANTDFATIEEWCHDGNWGQVEDLAVDEAKRLQAAGADFLIIGANTLHKLAERLISRIDIPLLSIVESTCKGIAKKGYKRVGLLGTPFTMDGGFYQKTFSKHGIEIITPEEKDRKVLHRIIYDELSFHKIFESSKVQILQTIDALSTRQAEAVILGCTELPILVSSADTAVPLLNSTKIHAVAAAEMALA